ncbi:helix-turn-helix domain-containing protein [Nocardia sp. NPDC051321]|uniref:helix-turn-helix domain-containing protein n=1 Tax=Nocardia sp. NPDC051321 TaxID=3364323 RepID=UPI0037BA8EB0
MTLKAETGRYCARCGARLSQYNTENLCGACESNYRVRPPELPLAFWRTDQMQDALATWHFGRVIYAYRTHPFHGRALPQETVAGWLGLTQAQLSRIEKGPAPEQLSKLVRWAEALQIPDHQLWFKLPKRNADSLDDVKRQSFVRGANTLGIYAWEVNSDVRRREFGKLAAATGATMFAEPWGDRGDRVGMADVNWLISQVDAFERADQRVGGAPLVLQAVEQLTEAKNLLETCSFAANAADEFTTAVGELAVLTGWLAVDADMHPLARQCYWDALSLANQANDPDLTAHACLYIANQSIALSRVGRASPHHAMKMIDRARDLMRGRPPGRIHALIAIRQAQAESLLGDQKAFGRAISTAWREVDHAVEYQRLEECPTWLQSVNHAEVRGHEARGYGTVGKFEKAVELLELAASEQPMVRNALYTRACLASARLAAGDVRGALTEAEPILTELDNTVSSPRTLKVLAPVRRAVESAPSTAEFRCQFDRLAR